jgi:hypothetical protein
LTLKRATPQEAFDLAATVGNLAPRDVKVAARLGVWRLLVERPRVSPLTVLIRRRPAFDAFVAGGVRRFRQNHNDLDRRIHPKICPMERRSVAYNGVDAGELMRVTRRQGWPKSSVNGLAW